VIGLIFGLLSLHIALFFVGLYSSSMFVWAIVGATLRLLVEDVRIEQEKIVAEEAIGDS
jgi:hypothetical protein